MRAALEKQLRNQLESVVKKARDIAEQAAREELDRLAVPEKTAADYLNDDQRSLRNSLRAHARQLGDSRKTDGTQGITLLVAEIAYEHWHRMLFSRFLAENNLLMYEDGQTPLAIQDCFDLAEEETGDRANGWQYAANYAAKMLPQIFRIDSPVFQVPFSPNHQKSLEHLLESLDESVFQSQDALGWVYQFWQAKRKEEVNASEVKIGARELSPVTQLFTEPYMVSFLLDNALGAWWANQFLSEADYANAQSEAELRQKVISASGVDEVQLNYLRFVRTYTEDQQQAIQSAKDKAKNDEGSDFEKPEPTGPWEPASGKFEQWPSQLSELKTLDPCCGSGHFLVAVFLMLIPMRMQQEGLSTDQAIDAVLRQNVHGLELDQRCVEIAAFALALEAWRYPGSSGYRDLPELHLACSGLSVKAAKEEWKQLAQHSGLKKHNLSIALDWLHKEFSEAPTLGSLLNPAKSQSSNIVAWETLSSALNNALIIEESQEHEGEAALQTLEATVAAQGLAKAATMMAGQYQWVVTNVPYLVQGKQSKTLTKYCAQTFPRSKGDLATVFLERCFDFAGERGYVSSVSPQNWLFQPRYKRFREFVLADRRMNSVARIGSGGFETISGEIVKVALCIHSPSNESSLVRNLDVSNTREIRDKVLGLAEFPLSTIEICDYLEVDGFRITSSLASNRRNLSNVASTLHGQNAGDNSRFNRNVWEVANFSQTWRPYQNAPDGESFFSGQEQIIKWENESGEMASFADSVKHLNHKAQQWRSGKANWGSSGIAMSLVGKIVAGLYTGNIYGVLCGVVIPTKVENIPALYSYAESGQFELDVRELDSNLAVQAKTLLAVPFDLDHWQKVADEKYPNGLPKPYSDDPTQWIYHGHPSGSVVWDEESKWTANNGHRIDDTVMQVATARLLGYRWPAETDPDMELADEQRAWVNACEPLLALCDDDGITCLPAVRGEKAAHERLEAMLAASYGDQWNTQTRNQLLEAVGCKNKSLDFWLREKFFEQHCKLFGHRPFIWHIWDGLKDGFAALVNYHQLDKKNLERLIYTYLDDWIRTQSHQQSEGVDGAAERLVAATNLKQKLEQILEGEAPYDIFVRWKPLEEQSIGWNPDLNDGVRLNIRPFMTVDDVGKKGAGILRAKPNIHWKKDRGKDVASAPWYKLGLEYGGKEGDRINEHHLSLAEKHEATK